MFEYSLKLEIARNKHKTNNLKKKIIKKFVNRKKALKVKSLNFKGGFKVKKKKKTYMLRVNQGIALKGNRKEKKKKFRVYLKQKIQNKLFYKANRILQMSSNKTLKHTILFGKIKKRFLLQLTTARKLVFRHKPYSYKERKIKPRKWLFRLKRKTLRGQKRKKKNTYQSSLRSKLKLNKHRFLVKIKTSAIALLKKKKLLLNTLIKKRKGSLKKRKPTLAFKKKLKKKRKTKFKKKFKRKPATRLAYFFKTLKLKSYYK